MSGPWEGVDDDRDYGGEGCGSDNHHHHHHHHHQYYPNRRSTPPS